MKTFKSFTIFFSALFSITLCVTKNTQCMEKELSYKEIKKEIKSIQNLEFSMVKLKQLINQASYSGKWRNLEPLIIEFGMNYEQNTTSQKLITKNKDKISPLIKHKGFNPEKENLLPFSVFREVKKIPGSPIEKKMLRYFCADPERVSKACNEYQKKKKRSKRIKYGPLDKIFLKDYKNS